MLLLKHVHLASPAVQARLLRLFEQGSFRRIGGGIEIPSRAKVICTSSVDLHKKSNRDSFLEELYVYLKALELPLPALHERIADMPEVIRAVLPRACRKGQIAVTFEELPEDLVTYFQEKPVADNFRGLEQALTRLLVHAPQDKSGRPFLANWRTWVDGRAGSRNKTDRDHDPLSFGEWSKRPSNYLEDGFVGIKEAEQQLFAKVVLEAQSKGMKGVDLAKALGISQPALTNRLKKAGLSL